MTHTSITSQKILNGSDTAAVAANKFSTPKIGSTLLRVAWLATLLGLTIELLLILLSISYGKSPQFHSILVELLQKISWSVLVCVGLAFGQAISKQYRTISASLSGFLAAPASFWVANSLHKGAAQALSVASTASAGPSPLLIGLIKAFEYACLGALLAYLSKKPLKVGAYLVAGLSVALLFGSIIILVTQYALSRPLTLVEVLSKGINEFVFPVGCSMVIFSSQWVSKLKLGTATS